MKKPKRNDFAGRNIRIVSVTEVSAATESYRHHFDVNQYLLHISVMLAGKLFYITA